MLNTCSTKRVSKMAAPGPRRSSMLPSSKLIGTHQRLWKRAPTAFSIEAFQAQSHAVIDSEQFYKTLRENGNQYGPRFQNVSSIWRAGDQSLGRLSVARQDGEIEPHGLHPSLLDSMTQLLAPFVMEKGKTFILRSIEKIEITDVNFPDTLWGHATLLPTDETVTKRVFSAMFGSSTSRANRIWNSRGSPSPF